MSFVLFEREGFVGKLTINRPEALNALNTELLNELGAKLDELAKSDLRCLIVTGAGEKAFVAGADIAQMKDLNAKQASQFSDDGNNVMEKLENLPFPVIAAVNGFALGGGCELALSCDLRIAADNAAFSFPEVGLGIIPGYGGMQRVMQVVGIAKAKELVYTTNRVKADEALTLGLVNAVVPKEELMDAATKMAEKIAGNAPLSVKYAKQVFSNSIGASYKELCKLESKEFGACFGTEDQLNAMNAFVEKRKPEPFTGK